jgi:Helix-turn-helix domain
MFMAPNHDEMLADIPPVQHTDRDLAASVHQELRPELIRVNQAERLFAISRSKIYELIRDRRIKSFCLRERNKIKGVRLIFYDSLLEFMKSEAEAQEE